MRSDYNNKSADENSQLRIYAHDIASLYRLERRLRERLESTNKQLHKYARDLSRTVSELKNSNNALKNAYLDTIHRLVLATEYKDISTGDHIARISLYSAMIARKICLPQDDIQHLIYAAPMHDIGKIGVPDNILSKTGNLTKDEFEIIKTHTTIGANILKNSRSEVLQLARQIAGSHHENWNGMGYPAGLSGEDIPIAARIVKLVDVFDALTSKRSYKDPYPITVACDILGQERGSHFDPELVDVMFDNIDEIISIKNEVSLPEDSDIWDFTWSDRDRTYLI